MATFTAKSAVDMSLPVYFYVSSGFSIISTGPNLIALRDPYGNRQDYLGSFSYGTYDLNWSSSSLTGFRQYAGSQTISWSITELSIPGSTYYSYAMSDDGVGLVSYALRGNDFVYGSSSGDVLFGHAGNDTLNGGTGADTMIGGLGNDTYVVDNTADKVTEKAAQGTDTVQSYITHTLAANVENLTLIGDAVINGTGNTLNNVLTGNSKSNRLNGGTGNDSIVGGGGQDKLTGGTGLDKFIYKSVQESGVGSSLRDTITDFKGSKEKDLIDLSAIDAFKGTAGNQAFVYIGSNAFTGTRGEVRFSAGVLQMNTGTDKIADMEIALTGVTSFRQNFLIL